MSSSTSQPDVYKRQMEHVGDMSAISATVGENFLSDPGLHRTLLGDGLATAMAGFIGGPANTTYGENTGVLELSRVHDPRVIRIAAVFAIIVSFIPKVSALISTCLLYTSVDETTQGVLNQISEGFEQKGAYNLRQNGIPLCHGDSEHIKIRKKEDKPGIDILIDGETKGEKVFIPVVVSVSGMTDLVYNDFYVADGADVTIVAGCGIHNGGCNDSRHDGIHTFHVGKNANVRYEEKHYGEGNGTGQRILNPVTNIEIGENSVFTLDTVQIKGVDSTIRTTNVVMDANSKLFVLERLMTDGDQKAESDIEVCMNGSGSSAQIISRSVGKGNSSQVFHPKAVDKNKCHAHIQCDSIIMDHAQVGSIPEIQAKHVDAAIIHEAAIGRINDCLLYTSRCV